MAIDTMEALLALPVGAKVTVDDLDHPYVRVDEEWMENTDGVRLRVRHFEGAVAAGKVEPYDPMRVARFTVRRGGSHYSLALREEGGNWWCFTFAASNPAQMYHNGPMLLTTTGMGTEVIEAKDVPWAEFGVALASQYETAFGAWQTERSTLQERVGSTEAQLARVQRQALNANALRSAMREFMEGSGA
jgi:hypothetical protein